MKSVFDEWTWKPDNSSAIYFADQNEKILVHTAHEQTRVSENHVFFCLAKKHKVPLSQTLDNNSTQLTRYSRATRRTESIDPSIRRNPDTNHENDGMRVKGFNFYAITVLFSLASVCTIHYSTDTLQCVSHRSVLIDAQNPPSEPLPMHTGGGWQYLHTLVPALPYHLAENTCMLSWGPFRGVYCYQALDSPHSHYLSTSSQYLDSVGEGIQKACRDFIVFNTRFVKI